MNINQYAIGYIMKARQAEVQKKADERSAWMEYLHSEQGVKHKHRWIQLVTKLISH